MNFIFKIENNLMELFKGLYKENKKNNLEVITVYSFEKEIIKIPAKFKINSKKFKANLHLKEFEILQ